MVRDAGCGDVWNGGIWSGVTGYADEKVSVDDGEEVSVDDGEEVNGDEESISWLQHALVVQKESEKRPLRDPTVEVQEAKWSEQQV
eukprot:s5867_g2.t1